MAPPSTVVETTCSAAMRPVAVAGSIFSLGEMVVVEDPGRKDAKAEVRGLAKIFYPFSAEGHQNYESTRKVHTLVQILISTTCLMQIHCIKCWMVFRTVEEACCLRHSMKVANSSAPTLTYNKSH